ncbi:MAG TPA: flavin reductase family protein [Gemmatimonadales bacterium]|nr:flavin reductase family protein [Gemmatimonadales bacterium]
MTDVSPDQFRALCGRFVTGVAVITAAGPDGSVAGMTANSFASVSLHPPLISVNVDESAEMYRVLGGARHFVLNILEASQEAISRRFAEDHHARFEGIQFSLNDRGIPVLDGTLATIECEQVQWLDAGDHRIFIARVIGGEAREGSPLLYFRGEYPGSRPA